MSLDRHEDDDDVLPVEEDTEDADREEDRADRQVVGKTDFHILFPWIRSRLQMPWPGLTLTVVTAVFGSRPTCVDMFCRLMSVR